MALGQVGVIGLGGCTLAVGVALEVGVTLDQVEVGVGIH